MKYKLNLIGIICCLIIGLSVVVFVNRKSLYIEYIVLFKKSTVLSSKNSEGKLNGEVTVYTNGKISSKLNFLNGKYEGKCIWYNEITGNELQETFYINGKKDGIEKIYYPSGKLKSSTNYRKDKEINSDFLFSEKGQISVYDVWGENPIIEEPYCWVQYDSLGKYHQVLGDVFSDYIYTKVNDTIIPLVNKHTYRNINDLFISVATPPQLKPETKLIINKINYKTTIKDNTINLANIFNKAGAYEIAIYADFETLNQKHINQDTLIITLYKN